ncbi:hypothetical protein C0995_003041 [Termitomyces sp. Mi166|nr:hypothetical protein C0995_003041 [Termitomyces sp. Mi166\
MSVSTRSSKHSALTRQLNLLLIALGIPIPLQSPTELTPSLLIAILEALLSVRIRYDMPSDTPENVNLQNTKIFLGVLETDVLKRDVGLSNLDPRQLANGGLEECTHVAELLCWIGRRLKYIVSDDPFEMHETPSIPYETHSPSTSITTRASCITSNFSMHYTSDYNTSIDSNMLSTPTPKLTPRAASPESRPRCIHEIPSPTLGSPLSVDNSITTEKGFLGTLSPSRRKVRRSGYISPVDEEMELLSFEHSRSISSQSTCNADHDVDHSFSLAALQESTAHTLFLYQQRARLLEEVARLESQQLQPS